MRTKYIQRGAEVSEFSQIPIWRRANKKDLIQIGFGLFVVLFVLSSYITSVLHLLPYDPLGINLKEMMQSPDYKHVLGTDFMGRDILSRIIVGSQAYFMPGLLSIIIALFFGTMAGLVSGYNGGRTDSIISYILDLIDSIPKMVIILLAIAFFRPGIYFIMLIVGITNIPTVASLIKSKVIFLKKRSFIEAAKALGLKTRDIIFKHILWYNCKAIVIIQATLGMAEVILIETSLSYLGFGVQEPAPSWGNMVAAGKDYFFRGDFFLSTAPAAAILISILGFYLLGDGLNNLLEWRRKR